jgi:hypothetical protein
VLFAPFCGHIKVNFPAYLCLVALKATFFLLLKSTIDKRYAQELKIKIGVFREKTTTNKSIFLVMVTVEGVKINS